MTIDEAISKYRNRVEQYKDWDNMKDIAEEHKQLTEWLEELKKYQSYKPVDKEFYKAGYNKAIDDFFDELQNYEDSDNWLRLKMSSIYQIAEQLKEGSADNE